MKSERGRGNKRKIKGRDGDTRKGMRETGERKIETVKRRKGINGTGGREEEAKERDGETKRTERMRETVERKEGN